MAINFMIMIAIRIKKHRQPSELRIDTRKLYLWLYILVSMLNLLTTVGAAVDVTYYQTINITYVPSAVKKGAVCLDGSPPAYHIDKGVGDGAHNWLVFLEGGSWCDTSKDCLNRTSNIFGLGSSKLMQPHNFSAILASQQQLNPYFYNWNRVFVRYCDGASFTGNNIDPVYKLHYKGAKIFEVLMKELLAMGMRKASNALIAGCSAGGLASILHCDKFRSLLPKKANVKCASDAGYFPHVKDVFGEYNYAKFYDRIVTLHGSTRNLPKSCTSKMKPKSLCFFPQYVVPFIKTPLFLMHSSYDTYQIQYILAPSLNNSLPKSWEMCKNDTRTCSPDQVEVLKEFRREFLDALPKEGNGSFRGMFINSCLIHCQTHLQRYWDWDPALRLGNKSMAEALGSWFYGSVFKLIDYGNNLPKFCNGI